jgi:hypothetical protein
MSGFPWQLPQSWQDKMRADDLAAERELEQRAAEAQDRADLAIERARHAERVFLYEHGCTPGEYHSAVAQFQAGRESRPPGAEYGSEGRPVVFIGDTEVGPRPEPPVQRSSGGPVVPCQDPDGEAYMRRQVAALQERQELSRRRERQAELKRLEAEVRSDWGFGEISR